MDFKNILKKAITLGVVYVLITVIIEGSFSKEVWMEKGMRAIIFTVLYALVLVVLAKYFNNKNK